MITKSRASRARRERATIHTNNTDQEKSSMKALLARFVREDSGQDLIEYGLLVGIITSTAVGAIKDIGPIVSAYYSGLLVNLNG